MRIAILTGAFPVLSETFVVDHVLGLAARGHDVEVYPESLLPPDALPDERRVAARRLVQASLGDDLRAGERLATVGRAWLGGPRLTRRLLAATVREELGSTGRLTLRLAARALPLLARRRFDVVHCHFGDSGQRAALLARAGVLDAPIVTTFHGYDVSELPRAHGSDCYRELFMQGARFIAVSGHVQRRLLELGAPAERTQIVRLGIDLDVFRPSHVPGEDARPVRIVSVGRLVDKKGHGTAIRAIAAARAAGVPVELAVVGEGPKRAELEALIAELGCGASVRLLGAMSRGDVREVLSTAQLFLMASRTASSGDEEGLPVALMEAMASGIPVVATRHGAIPELVEEGVAGFLADEDDVQGLAHRIECLARSPADRAVMGRAARDAVVRQHDAGRQLDMLERLYRSLP